jgi:hypothetical protein
VVAPTGTGAAKAEAERARRLANKRVLIFMGLTPCVKG